MGMNHADRAFAGDMAPDEVVTLQLIDARSDLIDVGSAACVAMGLPFRELNRSAPLNPGEDFLRVLNPVPGCRIKGHFRVLAKKLGKAMPPTMESRSIAWWWGDPCFSRCMAPAKRTA